MYYCNPRWHRGKRIDAAFLVQPLELPEPGDAMAYATCENHAGRALRVMLQQGKAVRVRKVSNNEGGK
jgi:hypothetical protein